LWSSYFKTKLLERTKVKTNPFHFVIGETVVKIGETVVKIGETVVKLVL
jgi:hypothetical protein